jgi:hypothetical protein
MDFMEVVSFSVVRLGKFDKMQSPLSCRLQIDINPGNPTVENAVFTTVFLTFPSGDTQNNAFMNMDGSKTTNGVFLVSRLSSFEIQAIKFAADKVIADKAAADKAVVDKAIADKVAADNSIVDKAIADRVAAEKAIANKAIANKALADRAIADKVAADKAIADRAIADRAAAYKAIAERAATDKAIADRGIADKVIADKAIADKAIAEKVIADKVIADKATADKAIADKAIADKVIADKAIANKAIADKAIADKVIADKVIADKAIADKVIADKAIAEKAAAAKKAAAAENAVVRFRLPNRHNNTMGVINPDGSWTTAAATGGAVVNRVFDGDFKLIISWECPSSVEFAQRTSHHVVGKGSVAGSLDDFTNITGGDWAEKGGLIADFPIGGYGTETHFYNNAVRVPNLSWWRYERIGYGFNNFKLSVSTSSENGPWQELRNPGFHGNKVICGISNNYGKAVCIARIVSCVIGSAY